MVKLTMATMLFYPTKECQNDMRRLGVASKIDDWAKRAEKDQNFYRMELVQLPFWKRRVDRKNRLAIAKRDLDEYIVYCGLRVFPHDKEYDQFLRKPESFPIPSDSDIRSFLEEKSKNDLINPRCPLNDTEEIFLLRTNRTKSSGPQDDLVLESRDWVEGIEQRIRKENRGLYAQLLGELVDHDDKSTEFTVFKSPRTPGIGIFYRYFSSEKILFLGSPLRPNDSETSYRFRYDEILKGKIEGLEDLKETLLRNSERAYPSLILADTELWLETQETRDANLALSPEEGDILGAVINSDRETASFPLFINGRPGSGKSTVLIYLFAEYLSCYLGLCAQSESGLSTPPLFLTYNERLLQEVRQTVERILRCDIERGPDDPALLENPRIKKQIEGAFGAFRDFLHCLLPEEDRSKFQQNNYVDFAKFRNFIQEKNSKGSTLGSPEIAWHVIRSYIKGMRLDENTTADRDFYKSEVLKRQRTVSIHSFQTIYDGAWAKYESWCRENQYWDDQDLVHRLLTLEQQGQYELGKYPAIFCDEAQDFTQIEIELILRLSIYPKRQVKPHLLSKIPFAFAGDPFQTLNPTGFSWANTKARFYTSLAAPLMAQYQNANLALNDLELKYNYRSAEPVVGFCNLIQIKRGLTFEIDDLEPQKAWRKSSPSHPVYFDSTRLICEQGLSEDETLQIIVPCLEGEEEEFIKEDDFLRSIAWDENENTVVRGVLSSMRAKGLQFKRVVLYKFGDYALREYKDEVDYFLNGHDILSKTDKEHFIETILPLEYFINRLYVAASRPLRDLIIVDTPQALTKFWNFASNPDFASLVAAYHQRQSTKPWQEEDLAKILPGERFPTDDGDDPGELGEDYRKRGQDAKDPYLLRQAETYFRHARKPVEESETKALRLRLEEKPKEAGNEYKKLQYYEQARACFWEARDYKSILDLYNQTQRPKPIEWFAAEFFEGGGDIDTASNLVHQVYEFLQDSGTEDKSRLLGDSHWPEVFEQVIKSLVDKDALRDHSNKIKWLAIHHQLHDLRKKIQLHPSLELARIAFEAEDYASSRQTLEQVRKKPNPSRHSTLPEWMRDLMARTEDYPGNLLWLDGLKRHQEILNEYEAHPDYPLDSQRDKGNIEVVFHAYTEVGANKDISRFVQQFPSTIDPWLKAVPTRGDEARLSAAALFLDRELQRGNWTEAINWTNGINNGSTIVKGMLIRRLARSERLSHETTDRKSQQTVSDYLKRHLIHHDSTLKKLLTVQEAGAAIERANKIIDGLNFYEEVSKGSWGNSPDLQDWAKERWIVVKLRQFGITSDGRRRRQIEKEIEQKHRSWDIPPVDQLPVFPILDPLGEIEEEVKEYHVKLSSEKALHHPVKTQTITPDVLVKVQFQVQVDKHLNLEGIVKARRRVLTLEESNSEAMVTIHVDEQKIDSSYGVNDPILLKREGNQHAVWHIQDWSLHCEFSRFADLTLIRLKYCDTGQTVFVLGI